MVMTEEASFLRTLLINLLDLSGTSQSAMSQSYKRGCKLLHFLEGIGTHQQRLISHLFCMNRKAAVTNGWGRAMEFNAEQPTTGGFNSS